jgi:hypothetical protein
MIKNCGRQLFVLSEEQSVPNRVRAGDFSAGVFENLRDIHDNKGLILNDEDRAPMKPWALHEAPVARLSANYQRQGGHPQWAAVSRAVDQSSNTQQAR